MLLPSEVLQRVVVFERAQRNQRQPSAFKYACDDWLFLIVKTDRRKKLRHKLPRYSQIFTVREFAMETSVSDTDSVSLTSKKLLFSRTSRIKCRLQIIWVILICCVRIFESITFEARTPLMSVAVVFVSFILIYERWTILLHYRLKAVIKYSTVT